MEIGASVCIVFLLLFSCCHSKSIQSQNISLDEAEDERIFALETTVKKLETLIDNVTKSKDKLMNPVMFYAKIADRGFVLQTLSTVVFETVILNIGGHYDQYDGIFVASRKGVYMFSWTVSIQSSKYVVTELVVEDKIISTAGNTDNNGGHHSASMTSLCRMEKMGMRSLELQIMVVHIILQ
ncbi:unnamed protein product [Mytilus edulis]|uniref:C1q domain-containing protein n=1 Tax=Mytilus edulis TaxID=6550 RepID=A0A8S3SLY0_MYTED|nr:unnamed protein product [Mytilus edulis]